MFLARRNMRCLIMRLLKVEMNYSKAKATRAVRSARPVAITTNCLPDEVWNVIGVA